MKQLWIRIVALIILLLSLTWLCRDPDWEPLLTFVAAFLGYLGLDIWQTFHSISANDRKLFNEFHKLFSKDSGVVEFLRDHDIATTFHRRMTAPLLDFYDDWKGVHYEFDDPTLEKAKKRFMAKVKEYVPILTNETYTHSVNPELRTMDFSDWDNPPERIAIRDRLNLLGSEVLERYEELIRVFRNKTKKTEQGDAEDAV